MSNMPSDNLVAARDAVLQVVSAVMPPGFKFVGIIIEESSGEFACIRNMPLQMAQSAMRQVASANADGAKLS